MATSFMRSCCISSWLLGSIGVPLLKILYSDDLAVNLSQAGIYSAAAKVAVLMNLFTQAFNYAAEPFFFNQADNKDAREIYAQTGRIFALVGSIVFLGIVLYIDIIQYFLGEDFREGLDVIPILLMAYLFLGLFYGHGISCMLADRWAGANISDPEDPIS